MSNVIALATPTRMRPPTERHEALLSTFALMRRSDGDVYWLKENAELLNILECTGQVVGEPALSVLQPVYDDLVQRMEFFPQYYRFHLSIALDAEALGMVGTTAERLIDHARRQGLPDAELSDLQRMEARRLFARRGQIAVPRDTGLEDRLRDFMERAKTFVLPNKKAAYELPHIVFYLSDYGRRDPGLGEGARLSLIYAGLLAEICIALRFAGEVPPQAWTDWLRREACRFEVVEDGATMADDYHEYFILNWHEAVCGGTPFRLASDGGAAAFRRGAKPVAPLRGMSEHLYALGGDRSGNWSDMKDVLSDRLAPEAMFVLEQVAASSPLFERFFQGFARASQCRGLAS